MNTANPKLSVIIVNWNGGDYIVGCLESVNEAALGLETDIIVVDNGSTDSSVSAIKKGFPRVAVIENHTNLGFGQGAQVGIESARGDFVAVVNPDVVLGRGSLHRLVTLLEERPTAAWAGPKVLTSDGVVQSGAFRLFSIWQPLRYITAIAPLLIFLSRGSLSEEDSGQPTRCERLCGACMVFRASMLAEIRGMPTTTFMYGEEQILGSRFRQLGYEVWYEPQSQVLHEDRSSTKLVWSDAETLLRTRIGLLVAMKETLTRPKFLVHNSLFLLATLLQGAVGVTGHGRGYRPKVARRFLRASLLAFFTSPALPPDYPRQQ